MARVLLFMFPALLDMVFGGSRFVCIQRLGNAENTSNSAVGMLLTTFAVGYLIGAKACGYFVSPRNAARILVGSCTALGTLSLLLIRYESFQAMYPLMFCFGLSLSLFFVPFQVFMKSVSAEGGAGLVKSTALYTGSWSLGIALGPFVGGYLWEYFGWHWCHVLSAVVSYGCAVGIYVFARTVGDRAQAALAAAAEADAAAGRRPANPYRHMPDLAMLGWICCSAGFLAMLMLLGVLPKLMDSLGLGEDLKGIVIAQLNLTQSLAAFAMITSRTWMYRPRPVLALGLLGAGSLVLFALSGGAAGLLIASGLFGVYAAMYCMCFVFYSLVHPTQSSRYLSVNESIVAVNFIVGPLVGGLVADLAGVKAAFLLAGLLVVVSVVVQAWVLRRRCSDKLPALHAMFSGGPEPLAALKVDKLDDYQGQPAWKITSPAAVYIYHEAGAGLAALLDRDGNDWITYRPGDGPRGEYRGIPNVIHPEGGFHPGATSGRTELLSASDDLVELESTAYDGKWKCRWSFYADRAVMELLAIDHPYWMLYEGTPGGNYDEDAAFMLDSAGTRYPCNGRMQWRLPEPRWLCFGTAGCRRMLMLWDRTERAADVVESYWSMEKAMTVFGFGRELDSTGPRWSHLRETPSVLELSFVEGDDYAAAVERAERLRG